jgi:hypothetical protein
MFIITEDPVKKNGTQFFRRAADRSMAPVYFNYGAAKCPGAWTASIFNNIPLIQQKLRKV